jgi:hypothetical protein
MGCGGIDADVQTDYQIQGMWLQGDYTLYINAASMAVKYFTDVSTPYRTEWSRDGDFDPTEVEGDLTLFDYKSNDEIASFNVSCVPGETLTISGISWNVEEYYYSNAFPKEGVYTAPGGTVNEGETTGTPSTSDMYDIDYYYDEANFPVPASISLKTATIGSDGDITITSVTYKGAAIATWPTVRAVGDRVVIYFNVGAPIANTNYAAATGLTVTFAIVHATP